MPTHFKRGNETELTYRLKWAAWEWLYTVARCRCVGFEVKLEGPGGRVVDLAAVGPDNLVYVVEVKACRADFSRDNHTPADFTSLRQRSAALERRQELAQQTLAQATALAQQAQPAAWERHPAYRLALADQQRTQRETAAYLRRVAAFSAKFHDPAFLAIADFHYLMAPQGVVPRRLLPPQWGLLDETPGEIVPAPRKPVRKNTGIVSNILRAIARANATSMMRAHGVAFTEEGAVFPKGNKVSGVRHKANVVDSSALVP